MYHRGRYIFTPLFTSHRPGVFRRAIYFNRIPLRDPTRSSIQVQPTYTVSNYFTFHPQLSSPLSEIVQEALLLARAQGETLLHRLTVRELKDPRRSSKRRARGKRESERERDLASGSTKGRIIGGFKYLSSRGPVYRRRALTKNKRLLMNPVGQG